MTAGPTPVPPGCRQHRTPAKNPPSPLAKRAKLLYNFSVLENLLNRSHRARRYGEVGKARGLPLKIRTALRAMPFPPPARRGLEAEYPGVAQLVGRDIWERVTSAGGCQASAFQKPHGSKRFSVSSLRKSPREKWLDHIVDHNCENRKFNIRVWRSLVSRLLWEQEISQVQILSPGPNPRLRLLLSRGFLINYIIFWILGFSRIDNLIG